MLWLWALCMDKNGTPSLWGSDRGLMACRSLAAHDPVGHPESFRRKLQGQLEPADILGCS